MADENRRDEHVDTKRHIYVLRDGEKRGPYSPRAAEAMLDDQILSADDLAWYEGLEEWQALGDIILSGAAPSPSRPQQATIASDEAVLLALKCQSCGGSLDYVSDRGIANCPFCDSSHLVRLPASGVERLRDLESGSLPVSHFPPVIPADAATEVIVRAIRAKRAGLKAPESLVMRVTEAYFPAWVIDATVQCSWQGEYSEKRTVTKWRKVYKSPQNGPSYQVDEPYNDTETIWHPSSGNQMFSTTLFTPAADGFSQHQLNAVLSDFEGVGAEQGHPRSAGRMAVATPGKSQNNAWNEYACDARIEAQGYDECRGCVERLKNVRSVVTAREFSLIYLPLAVVSYAANESGYRHLVNLQSGAFSGDLPLDENSIRKECVAAGRRQKNVRRMRWFAATVACIAIAFLGTHLWYGDSAVFSTHWLYWLGGFALVIWGLTGGGTPWEDFMWRRRAYLFRLLAHPPPALKGPMHAGIDFARIQRSVAEMAESNSLEDVERSQAAEILQHPAMVLLRAASPGAALRLPILVRVTVPILLAAATIFINSARLVQVRDEAKPEPTTSVPRAIAVQEEDIFQPPPPTPRREESYIYKPAPRPGPQRSSADPRVVSAQAELAKLQDTIESKRARWKNASDLVNKLTYNGHIPVTPGSSTYVQFAEASQIMREVEKEAVELNARKTQLETFIRQAETNDATQ